MDHNIIPRWSCGLRTSDLEKADTSIEVSTAEARRILSPCIPDDLTERYGQVNRTPPDTELDGSLKLLPPGAHLSMRSAIRDTGRLGSISKFLTSRPRPNAMHFRVFN